MRHHYEENEDAAEPLRGYGTGEYLSCGIRAEAGRARNDILSAGDTEKRGETEDLKKEKLVF